MKHYNLHGGRIYDVTGVANKLITECILPLGFWKKKSKSDGNNCKMDGWQLNSSIFFEEIWLSLVKYVLVHMHL